MQAAPEPCGSWPARPGCAVRAHRGVVWQPLCGAPPAPAFLPARRFEQPRLAFEDADAASDDTARRGLLGDEVRTRFGAGRGAGRRAARRAKPSSAEKEEEYTDARRRVS